MRNPVPGYRFFECENCDFHYRDKTRDCLSPSGDHCESCGEFNPPTDYEKHPEWPTDGSGNLIVEPITPHIQQGEG